jgi:hypothetical protein
MFVNRGLALVEATILSCSDDFKNCVEDEDVVASFIRHYKSKRSAAWIAAKVADYERYVGGEMSAHEVEKYLRRTGFIKDEANPKIEVINGQRTLVGRPRAIIQMTDVDLIEGHQVCELMAMFNLTAGRVWQKKTDTTEEAIARLRDMLYSGSVVTSMDISAFESSRRPEYGIIERYAMIRMCQIADFPITLAALQRRWTDQKVDIEGYGLVFSLETRLSGDFETSFGNGFLMATLQSVLRDMQRDESLRCLIMGTPQPSIQPNRPPTEGKHDNPARYR